VCFVIVILLGGLFLVFSFLGLLVMICCLFGVTYVLLLYWFGLWWLLIV